MSPAKIRILQLVLGAVCLGLTGIVVSELLPSDTDIVESPAGDAAIAVAGDPVPQLDFQKLEAEILDRPLFTPGRKPPQAKEDMATDDEEEQAKPPELQSRLAGVTIRPDYSEALFARDGEKPVAVKEGDEIDGWTVDSIERDRVVLTSDFGERVLEPTAGERVQGAAAPNVAKKKPVSAAAKILKTPTVAIQKGAATPGAKGAAPSSVKPPAQATAPVKPSTQANALQPSQTSAPAGRHSPQPWGL